MEQRTILHFCLKNVPPDKLRNNIISRNRRKNVENFPKTRLKLLFPVLFLSECVKKALTLRIVNFRRHLNPPYFFQFKAPRKNI